MVLFGLLLWFTLLPSGLEQPLVQAVHGCCALSVNGGFWKNFLFYVLCVGLFALGNLDSAFALVSFSPSGVCVLPVEYVAFGTRALLGWTVDTCSTGGFGRISVFLHVAVNSNPEADASPFLSVWRSVHSRCYWLQLLSARLAR